MSRIGKRLGDLRGAGRKALIPFVTAGDPDLVTTLDIMHGLVAGGADIIELGVPFSDPMADGPVIQRASERALDRGVRLADVLELVKRFRQRDADTPVVLMGYLNPVEVMGYERFADAAADVGVDGALVVDLPPEEAATLRIPLSAHGLDLIFLLAPTTTDERARRICAEASGYLYYVSLKGVTGAGNLQIDSVAGRVAALRAITDLPIGVGFGIADRESATAVARVSDGVVIGSALVRRIEELSASGGDVAGGLQAFLADIRAGLDSLDSEN